MKSVWHIFGRLRNQKAMIAIAVVLTAVQCALELYLPWLMADIINHGVLGGNQDVITKQGRWMLIACVVMGFVGYGTSISCAYISQRFALTLRKDLYRHISLLSMEQIDSLQTGSLITRITADIAICASLVNVFIMLFIEPLLLTGGGIYMMWGISRDFGVVFSIFVVFQLALMVGFIILTAPKFIKVQTLTDGINGSLQTTFSNFRMIKGFTTEDRENKSFSEKNDTLFKTAFDVQKLLAVFNPAVMLLMNSAVAYILYTAGVKVSIGNLSVGEVVAAITYSEQILLSIMVGGQMLRTVSESIPSAGRICQVLQMESKMPQGGAQLEGKVRQLRCKQVGFAYEESGPVIENCDFTIGESEYIAMIGRIGAGKSTLSSLMGRFYDVTSGTVEMNGIDAKTLDPESIRRHVAVVDRQAAVFEGTFTDNIAFGRDYVTQQDVELAAKTAQCESFIKRQPEGFDTVLVSLGHSISGGEKQRLVIARALAGKPDILILDDSTSAMDYHTEAQLLEAIRKNYPEMALMLVTHRLPSAKSADKIAVFGEKRVLDVGTDEELHRRCPAYRTMMSGQSGEEVSANG